MQHTTSLKGLVSRWSSRFAPVAAVLAVAAVTAASAVEAQDRRDFDIVNSNRRVPINTLNVSSSARTEWGGNVLRVCAENQKRTKPKA